MRNVEPYDDLFPLPLNEINAVQNGQLNYASFEQESSLFLRLFFTGNRDLTANRGRDVDGIQLLYWRLRNSNCGLASYMVPRARASSFVTFPVVSQNCHRIRWACDSADDVQILYGEEKRVTVKLMACFR
jgi:hypothetical protein